MKQADLVKALRAHADAENEQRLRLRGQTTFASFLARYVEELVIPADQEYDFWRIDDCIPMIIVGAVRVFETSKDDWVIELRRSYEEATGHSFRDPTRVHPASNVEGAFDVEMIKYVMRDAADSMSNHLDSDIDALLNAERHVISLLFARFRDQVYNAGGLSKIIATSTSRGMQGEFGSTTLRSYVMAGRLMFTFARKNGDQEQSVSFIGQEDDLIGLGGGMRSCYAELHEALAMIEDVILNWPTNKSTFKDNNNVSIG